MSKASGSLVMTEDVLDAMLMLAKRNNEGADIVSTFNALQASLRFFFHVLVKERSVFGPFVHVSFF
jgi:hypothetical protein